MIILAVDPGPVKGGVVVFNWAYEPYVHEREVLFADDVLMDQLALAMIGEISFDIIFDKPDTALGSGFSINDIELFAMEDIVCTGQIVGQSTFDTAKVIGDLKRCWYVHRKTEGRFILPNHDMKVHLCGGMTQVNLNTGRLQRVTDAQVKAAVRSKFLATGAGTKGEIGTKNNPGPLYRMKGLHHPWFALAIGITCVETCALYGDTVVPFKKNVPRSTG